MNAWTEIWNTIRDDFSDLKDVAGVTRVAIRLLLAAGLGAVLGWERESKGKTAGLRTHMLVAMGAALFVLIPKEAGLSDSDQSRVLQGLVAGIGFLGAGSILNTRREQGEIQGLTTATGLWLTAAIGVAAGMGREALAVLSTALCWLTLAAVPWIMNRFEPPPEDAKN